MWEARLGVRSESRSPSVPSFRLCLTLLQSFSHIQEAGLGLIVSPIRVLSDRGGNLAGHLHNYAKGICLTGYFATNDAGEKLSSGRSCAETAFLEQYSRNIQASYHMRYYCFC